MNDRLIRMLSDSVVDMNSANNLILIHTLPGSAHVAGEAVDSLHWPEILGSLAGDNTILLVIRAESEASQVVQRIQELMK